MKYAIVSVDFQNSYLLKDLEFYCFRPGLLSGIVRYLYPLLKKYEIQVYQIMSDYRAPSKEHKIGCQPGTIGFLSGLDNKYCFTEPFYKANISPVWRRKNIGLADSPTDEPFIDPKPFNDWVTNNFPAPSDVKIILIGIGIESSMFATAKEFSALGYDVYFLYEACDTVRHNKAYKKLLFENSPLLEYVGLMTYKKLKKDLKRQGERRVINVNRKTIPQGMEFFSRTNNEVSIYKKPNPDITVYAKDAKLAVTDVDVNKTADKGVTLKLNKEETKPFTDTTKKEVKEAAVKKVSYVEDKTPTPKPKKKYVPKESKTRTKIMNTVVTKEGNVTVHDKYMREKDINRIERAMNKEPAKAKRKKDE